MARRRGEEELVEIEYVRLVEARETPDAFLVIVPTYGKETKPVWIPKSQIIEHDEDAKTMTVPEWLATDRGMT